SVQIYENINLENISALSSLTVVGGDLIVLDNPTLRSCSFGFGPLLTEGLVSGSIVIRDNAPGCNSIEEILASYTDAEDEAVPLIADLVEAYPNPTIGPVALAYTLAAPAEVTLAVHDVLGRRVSTLVQAPRPTGTHEVNWTSTDLPAGVYVVRLDAGGEVHTQWFTLVR
ncbi:MAG: T9SS type A sorting domain-containing protein, partial [Bacteroidota bacterium]